MFVSVLVFVTLLLFELVLLLEPLLWVPLGVGFFSTAESAVLLLLARFFICANLFCSAAFKSRAPADIMGACCMAAFVLRLGPAPWVNAAVGCDEPLVVDSVDKKLEVLGLGHNQKVAKSTCSIICGCYGCTTVFYLTAIDFLETTQTSGWVVYSFQDIVAGTRTNDGCLSGS